MRIDSHLILFFSVSRQHNQSIADDDRDFYFHQLRPLSVGLWICAYFILVSDMNSFILLRVFFLRYWKEGFATKRSNNNHFLVACFSD